jgi:hypothetical protein
MPGGCLIFGCDAAALAGPGREGCEAAPNKERFTAIGYPLAGNEHGLSPDPRGPCQSSVDRRVDGRPVTQEGESVSEDGRSHRCH